MYTPDYFKNKKITVMGLGLLGRGMGDVRFLAEEGAELIVTDLKSETELQASIDALRSVENFEKITFVLGEHRLEDFKDRDFILKAAGVPRDSVYIAEARKNNIPIEMSSALFAALTPAMVIGVTGTRGKSTVTHLLHAVLEKAYGGTKKIFLGGNVKGVSTLAFLRETKESDIAVLELDSWQLQGFGDRKISPHIALFTTFFADHLNYYNGNMVEYLEDKLHIFKYQTTKDYFIMGEKVSDMLTQKYKDDIHARTRIARTSDIPLDWKLLMPGEHNRYNASLVLAAARILEISDEITQQIFSEFKGVSGRLEFITEIKGVKIFNDTTATTPDATIAALKALDKNIILIMGGADKSLDMSKLVQAIPDHAKRVVLLAGTGSDKINDELKEALKTKLDHAKTLHEAVEKAMKHTHEGDKVLFSPAFASFGLFKNEFDRGEQFVDLVKKL